jgi:hypothetical protein
MQHHIDNLTLLHKSKEETLIDLLQRQFEESGSTDPVDDEDLFHEADSDSDAAVSNAEIVNDIITNLDNDKTLYTHEAVDANWDAGYLETGTGPVISNIQHYNVPLKHLHQLLNIKSQPDLTCLQLNTPQRSDHKPDIFVTETDSDERGKIDIIRQYNLQYPSRERAHR